MTGVKALVTPTAPTLASRFAALRSAEALGVRPGAVEGLGHLDAGDVLLDVGADIPDRLPGAPERAPGEPGEQGGGQSSIRGMTTKEASARRHSSRSMATKMPTRPTTLPRVCTRPWESSGSAPPRR